MNNKLKLQWRKQVSTVKREWRAGPFRIPLEGRPYLMFDNGYTNNSFPFATVQAAKAYAADLLYRVLKATHAKR